MGGSRKHGRLPLPSGGDSISSQCVRFVKSVENKSVAKAVVLIGIVVAVVSAIVAYQAPGIRRGPSHKLTRTEFDRRVGGLIARCLSRRLTG